MDFRISFKEPDLTAMPTDKSEKNSRRHISRDLVIQPPLVSRTPLLI